MKFLPTEGYFIKLDQDVAGLGGDNKFLRHELHADWYYTIVPEFVFNLGISAGHIFGIGGEKVKLANRFFLGGTTFPGFQYGGVGPSDRDTGDLLGGNTYYVGSAELRFPLGLPEELRIYGRAFTYAGTLYDIDVSGPTLEDSSKLRLSSGLGVSWLSPLGPLSLDFTQALIKNQLDQTEFFTVNFGTQF